MMVAVGMGTMTVPCAYAGMLDDENANKATTTTATPAAPAANATVDANGVALPGHEVKSDELKKIEAERQCVKINKRADGTVESSETGACVGVDYTQKNPTGSDSRPETAMGADARDQAAYNPPKNLKINKQTMSWAKYESFKQIGESKGYSQEAIQGIAARLQVESGGTAFGMKSIGSTGVGDLNRGGSFGVEQWNGVRADNMVNYVNEQRAGRADATGGVYGTVTKTKNGLQNSAYDQYNYVFEELERSPSTATGGKATVNALKNSTSAQDAAYLWTAKVERPANQAGQAYGLAGGNMTDDNAKGFAAVGNNAYVANTDAWGSKSLVKYDSSGFSYTAGGGRNPTAGLGNTLNAVLGGNGGSVQNLVSQLTGGNNAAGALVNGLLSGQMDQSQMLQIATQMALQQLSQSGGGSDDEDEDESDGGRATGGSGDSDDDYDVTQVKVTQAVSDLAKQCGADLPKTKEALMLMIKSCQSLEDDAEVVG